MGIVLDRLNEKKILVSDGAWGTFLYQKGLEVGDCPELWNTTHSREVEEIAQSYVEAGSDMILTNSFGGSPNKLKHFSLEDRCAELNQRAAEISRKAAGHSCLVLGSMGPSGAILMMGEITSEELYQGFYTQAQALKAGGVDAICVETMSAVDEAEIAVKAAKEATGLDILCTFTFNKGVNGDFKTMMGHSPTDIIGPLKQAGASVVGTNCGNGIDNMLGIVKEIRGADSKVPILVQANAGLPVLQNGETTYPETAEIMASKMGSIVQAGATLIGGCCGTTPKHIRLMVANIDKLR